MATGKTNAHWYRVLLDGVDISGDVRSVGEFGIEWDEVAHGGFSDGVENYTLGKPSVSLMGINAVFNNTAATGSFTELKNREEYIATVAIGIRAAPTVGDPCFSAPLEQKQMKMAGDGPLVLSADLIGPGQGETLPTEVFGKVVAYAKNVTATGTGTGVNDLAASGNGAIGYLHVTTAETVGTWTIKLAHSSDDSSYADLMTFTADGTSVLGEQQTASGTINQYTRYDVTASTTGSAGMTFTMTVVRT